MKNNKIIVFVVILIVLLSVGIYRFNLLDPLLKPKPKSIATKQMPGEYTSERGTIVGLQNDVLEVNTKNGVKRFSIADTVDIQGIVSGSVETHDTVTVQTTKEDLKPGKEVILYVKKGTDFPRSIYIIK